MCVRASCTPWVVNKGKTTSSLIPGLADTWKYIIQFGKQDTF